MFRFLKNWLFIGPSLQRIDFKLAQLKEYLMTTQEKVNAIAAQLVTIETNIRQDIADLKAANPTVDFSALDASVAGLTALDAENPAPPVP